MPNSLKCRLKKLANQGLLSEKDLNRIVIIPDRAKNGEVIEAIFPDTKIDLMDNKVIDWWYSPYKKGEQE